MPALVQAHRELLPADLDYRDITVTPGYRYSLFIAPFASGTVKVESLASDKTVTRLVSATTDAASTGKIVELVAATDTFRITPSAAVTVYIELHAIKSVANATDAYV